MAVRLISQIQVEDWNGYQCLNNVNVCFVFPKWLYFFRVYNLFNCNPFPYLPIFF